jgi:hypothetical protein
MCVEKPYWLNWVLFSSLFGLAGWALLRGRFSWLAMLSPALFCFGFNTAVSNNLPRYNKLLIPILWVATAIVLHRGIGSLAGGGRWKRRTETSNARDDA